MKERSGKFLFILTVFTGSYLLFQIQPLIGKIITPKYGGIAAVWCLCMLFFQICLLAGYSLTFALRKLTAKKQATIYLALLGLSTLFLNIPSGNEWAPAGTGEPIGHLLLLLARYLALPCILLSSVSGLFQNWYRMAGYGNPYPLYSISNMGSLGALLLYPIVIEPVLPTTDTIHMWLTAYRALFVLAFITTLFVFTRFSQTATETNAPASFTKKRIFQWGFFSTCGSVLLISMSNFMTQEIAPVPLLWVIPLCIYLLTFILAFQDKPVYRRNLFLRTGMLLIFVFVSLYLTKFFYILPILVSFPLACFTLFWLCMICHGELSESKPDPAYLPAFYLLLAAGGALGGILVNLVAPLVFDTFMEFDLILYVLLGFCIYAVTLNPQQFGDRLLIATRKLFPGLAIILVIFSNLRWEHVLYSERNFYGMLAILEDEEFITMLHGKIIHGTQYRDPAKRHIPVLYFANNTGVGIVNKLVHQRHPEGANIGVIGLGAGAYAAYAQPNDRLTFYEIDGKVLHAAEKYFTFLKDTKAPTRHFLGDGRLTLEAQPPQQFDLLAIDAFNGDAVPTHLLTREAIALYLKHLKPDGLMIFQATNAYVDLPGVIARVTAEQNLTTFVLETDGIRYVLVSREPRTLNELEAPGAMDAYPGTTLWKPRYNKASRVWTDDYSNLFSALRLQR